MENKINIAELLKDCPKGMELDCTMYNNVTLLSVDDGKDILFPIRVLRKDGCTIALTKYGQYADADFAKCVIFPKGKTTWEGFVPPCKFKDGDIITEPDGNNTFILHYDNGKFYDVHCAFMNDHLYIYKSKNNWLLNSREVRFATEEEKQKLFDAIKANGYKWNEETKTLEKLVEPMFKINNIIRHKERKSNTRIVDIKDGNYIFENGDIMPIYLQSDYEFITDKFDINTLKPFDKVLVRQSVAGRWEVDFFGFYNEEYYHATGGCAYAQCIPYEGNEHLLNTTNDCDEYYKTWEK